MNSKILAVQELNPLQIGLNGGKVFGIQAEDKIR